MFMLCGVFRKTSFLVAAGGGVHGRTTGIVHVIMTEAGSTIKALHRFIESFPQTGGIITSSNNGKVIKVIEVINGVNIVFPIGMFNLTGKYGEITVTRICVVTVIGKVNKNSHKTNMIIPKEEI